MDDCVRPYPHIAQGISSGLLEVEAQAKGKDRGKGLYMWLCSNVKNETCMLVVPYIMPLLLKVHEVH